MNATSAKGSVVTGLSSAKDLGGLRNVSFCLAQSASERWKANRQIPLFNPLFLTLTRTLIGSQLLKPPHCHSHRRCSKILDASASH
jgi:hypothetical protein